MSNTTNSKSGLLGTVLLVCGTVFWGMTFVFIKEGVGFVSVYTFLSWRFLIAAAVLGLIFIRKLPQFNWKIVKHGLLLSIPLAAGYITQTIGLKYTAATKAGFITGLSVVLVPVIGTFIGRRPLTLQQWAAAGLAAVGLALLTVSGSFSLNKGDVWVILCAIAFAAYIVMVNRLTVGLDAVLLTLVQLVTVGVLTGVISLAFEGFVVPKGYPVWQAILFTSLFATAFMYTVQNHFQKDISEVKAAIIYSFEPLFAAVTAFIYLHEQLTWRMAVGGLLIFLAMLAADLKFSRKALWPGEPDAG